MFNNIWNMYTKDLMETLRDRRTLLRMLLVPSLMLPMLGHFLLEFSQDYQTKSEEEVLQYSIVGTANLPELGRVYEKVADFEYQDHSQSSEAEVRALVTSGNLDFALIIPEGTREQLRGGERISLTLVYNNSAGNREILRNRAAEPLDDFNERQRDWRLLFLGVTGYEDKKKLLDPVRFESLGTASTREMVGQGYGGLVAYFIFLVCFMGCIFTSADLAAGEKERGTMETLLVVPVPRLHLVLGKYLVIFTMGVIYVTLSLASLSTWLIVEGMRDAVVSADVLDIVTPVDIIAVWLMLFPIAAIFAAVLLSISVYAKSFREATSLSSLANFIVIIAAVAGTLPGIKLDWVFASIPVANVALAIKEIIKGTLTDYSMVAVVLGSTTVLAVALIIFCTKWFEREDVIFRE